MNINYIKSDLIARGFAFADNGTMYYAEGSISRYTKCSVCLSRRIWGDMAQEFFYPVRYESFAESGQPEVDHHTINECYVAESEIFEFMKRKGILTKAESEERRANLRNRMRAMRG